LKHNNPTVIGLWESRCIWPNISKPDVVLSLGTGSECSSQSPVSPNWFFDNSFVRLLNGDNFVPRLWKTFMISLDGEEAWNALWNSLDDKAREDFIRLNIEFPGRLPAIDDVEAIDTLSRMVYVQHQGSPNITKTLTALLVSCFFFELDGLPEYENGLFKCRGSIRCRSRSTEIIRALLRIQPDGLELFNGFKSLGFFPSEDDICSACSLYKRPVWFSVQSLSEIINLYVRWNIQETRSLSALPQPISWFVEMQQLHSPFGSSNHGDPQRYCCHSCHPLALVSRKIQPLAGQKRKKIEMEDDNCI